MARCPGCGGTASEACVCGWVNSDCIAVTGSGESGDEFSASPILDPASTNILSCGEDGLRAEVSDTILNPPRGRVSRADDQAVSSGVLTTITWPDEDYDTDGMHAAASGNIVCVTPGTYDFAGTLIYEAANDAGFTRDVRIDTVDGRLVAREREWALDSGVTFAASLSGDIDLTVGQTVRMRFQHERGSPLDVLEGYLSWHYVGPTP